MEKIILPRCKLGMELCVCTGAVLDAAAQRSVRAQLYDIVILTGVAPVQVRLVAVVSHAEAPRVLEILYCQPREIGKSEVRTTTVI